MVMTYDQQGDVAVVRLDDGKANAVSHTLISEVNEALDRAEKEAKAVVIVGAEGKFSAGFDLKEIQKGPAEAAALVNSGGKMLLRMFSHPQPLIGVCTGHAIAAGGFMLLACDTRFGVPGDFKIGLNETAIGMTLPVFGLELAEHRLSKRHLTAAVIQAQLFSPEEAVDVGFLDEVVAPDAILDRATEVAAQLAQLPGETYGSQKRVIRAGTISTIEASLS